MNGLHPNRFFVAQGFQHDLAHVGPVLDDSRLLGGRDQCDLALQLVEEILRALERCHVESARTGEHVANDLRRHSPQDQSRMRDPAHVGIVDVPQDPLEELALNVLFAHEGELREVVAARFLFDPEHGRGETERQRVPAHLLEDGRRELLIRDPVLPQEGQRRLLFELRELDYLLECEFGDGGPADDHHAQLRDVLGELADEVTKRLHEGTAAVLNLLERIQHEQHRQQGIYLQFLNEGDEIAADAVARANVRPRAALSAAACRGEQRAPRTPQRLRRVGGLLVLQADLTDSLDEDRCRLVDHDRAAVEVEIGEGKRRPFCRLRVVLNELPHERRLAHAAHAKNEKWLLARPRDGTRERLEEALRLENVDVDAEVAELGFTPFEVLSDETVERLEQTQKLQTPIDFPTRGESAH